jgi:hypothetical protein
MLQSMTRKKSQALETVERILSAQPRAPGGGKKLVAEKQAQLIAAGIGSKIGVVFNAGRVANGKFYVHFASGPTAWGSEWPAWAYEPARDSLMYGRKLWVSFEGTIPIGANLLSATVLHPMFG